MIIRSMRFGSTVAQKQFCGSPVIEFRTCVRYDLRITESMVSVGSVWLASLVDDTTRGVTHTLVKLFDLVRGCAEIFH